MAQAGNYEIVEWYIRSNRYDFDEEIEVIDDFDNTKSSSASKAVDKIIKFAKEKTSSEKLLSQLEALRVRWKGNMEDKIFEVTPQFERDIENSYLQEVKDITDDELGVYDIQDEDKDLVRKDISNEGVSIDISEVRPQVSRQASALLKIQEEVERVRKEIQEATKREEVRQAEITKKLIKEARKTETEEDDRLLKELEKTRELGKQEIKRLEEYDLRTFRTRVIKI